MRLTGDPVEVASGIDALYLSGRAVLKASWLRELAEARHVAGSKGLPSR